MNPLAKASYAADVGGLVFAPGCTNKVPAITACVQRAVYLRQHFMSGP